MPYWCMGLILWCGRALVQDARTASENHRWISPDGRGRDEDFSSPLHRSRRALLTHRAPPRVRRRAMNDLVPLVGRRAVIIRIDAAFRLSIRTAAAWLFPLGEALPSTTSAGSYSPCSVASQVLHETPNVGHSTTIFV
jgi:hypothetical protein